MSIDLTEIQKAELERGRPVAVEEGRYVLLSRRAFERVKDALEIPHSDPSLFEVNDLPDE